MKKYENVRFPNCQDDNDDENSTFDCSKEPNFITLSEIFPTIPKKLFYPINKLNEEEMSQLIINLTAFNDKNKIMEYLSNFLKEQEIELESLNISRSTTPVDNTEMPSLDDDKILAQLENEKEKCLILGRTFIKEAHKMFSSKFGLENVDIDDIPPEITEMSWKVPESLMLNLYKAFFEEIGFIESENEEKKIIANENVEENMTMREIMELEEALDRSIQTEKILISKDRNLQSQLDILEWKYPDFSKDELLRIFISFKMDMPKVIDYMENIGHKSKNWTGTGESRKVNNSKAKSKEGCTANMLKIERLQQRIDQEKNRLQYTKDKLNLINSHDLHAQVAGYWTEELSQCKQRLIWYQEQIALASEAQQSLEYGNRQLDLHGFTQVSAIVALDNRIQELRSSKFDINKGNHLLVICGRGLHSLNGRPRLKPAIRKYLINSAIKYDEPFDGTFKISLKQF